MSNFLYFPSLNWNQKYIILATTGLLKLKSNLLGTQTQKDQKCEKLFIIGEMHW